MLEMVVRSWTLPVCYQQFDGEDHTQAGDLFRLMNPQPGVEHLRNHNQVS